MIPPGLDEYVVACMYSHSFPATRWDRRDTLFVFFFAQKGGLSHLRSLQVETKHLPFIHVGNEDDKVISQTLEPRDSPLWDLNQPLFGQDAGFSIAALRLGNRIMLWVARFRLIRYSY